MARIILKSPYLKPNATKHLSNYVRYIAKRDGVEMPSNSNQFLNVTTRQKNVISELLVAFPDSRELYEYEDYVKNPDRENADEFILRISELHGELLGNREQYVDYIATRPHVAKIAEHGLFTDDGIPVVLEKVAKEVASHTGNVWTHIISLHREDAARLGYDSVDQWEALLRSQRNMIAQQMKIAPENFQWYAAFHNEGHHPHVHMMAFSIDPSEPYLTENGIHTIKKNLAKEIFRQDLISIYQKQTKQRDTLRKDSSNIIEDIVKRINSGGYDNSAVEIKLIQLAERLSKTSGKKVYGYLKSDVKAIVNSIVDEMEKDKNISALYDLWYEQRREVIRTYTDKEPERIPLSQNPDFKSIRNAVINEAMNIVLDRKTFEDDNIPDEIDEEYDMPDEPVPLTEYDRLVKKNNKTAWDKYHLGVICLDAKSEYYDIKEGIRWLIDSAQGGNSVAQYKIGKLYLQGNFIGKDVDYAFRWLIAAAEKKNSYAQCLLGKTYLRGEDVTQDLELALYYLESADGHGNAYAAYLLGRLYLDGKDIPPDRDTAIGYLIKSADSGFESAEYLLGKLLLDSEPEKAVAYLSKAAGKKNQFAEYLLGKYYLSANDPEQAVWYLERSTEQKSQWAQYALGKLYLYGKDVPYNPTRAMQLLTASAEQGNQYAENLLNCSHQQRNITIGIGVIRLFYEMSRILQDQLSKKDSGRGISERKQLSLENKRRKAHGQRLE